MAIRKWLTSLWRRCFSKTQRVSIHVEGSLGAATVFAVVSDEDGKVVGRYPMSTEPGACFFLPPRCTVRMEAVVPYGQPTFSLSAAPVVRSEAQA